VVVAFIDAHQDRETEGLRWGVEPICAVLQVAPSTYYAAKRRPPSRRKVEDARLKARIRAVYQEHFGVYGAEKVWRQLGREGVTAGRDRVARLMRELGLAGATRAKTTRTPRPATREQALPADLVGRDFTASAPNRLWVTDLTYVPLLQAGFAYTAFVVDACSRRIVGWQVAASLEVDLALDALEMAIWTRRGDSLEGLVHHSDRGGQYLALRYTARLEEAGIVPSVGSKGDSYDNALAETVNGLYKAELIRRRGPWRTVAAVAVATAAWVAWWNAQRLHSALGHVPPAEYEAAHQPAAAAVA
jgi:putative transposase